VGQKTHPKGFRFNHSKHLSEWYSNKLSYPALMEEDYFIRTKSMHISKNFYRFQS
jgi:hypothetical protein